MSAGAATGVEGLLAPTTDFSQLEQGEDKPGGEATSRGTVDTPNAFSLSSGNMGFRRELNFKIGNAIFRRHWVSAPSSTEASDGLGPLFNSRGCQNCHLKDGRGHPPFSSDVPDDTGSMLIRLSVPPKTDAEKAMLAAHKVNSIPDPVYGGQLQDFAIQGFAAEGKAKIEYTEKPVTLAGGETVAGLEVLAAPGHASHHVVYLDPEGGDAFVGDVGGVRIPPGETVWLPTPPPDIDLEAWRTSIAAVAERRPERLRLTHYGSAEDPESHLAATLAELERLAESSRERDRDRFLAGLEARIGAEPPDLAERVRSAMPPEQTWLGLERYQRRRKG